MNDRYLYRAKRTDNGEWVKGHLVELGKESYSDEIRYWITEKSIPILGKTVFNLSIDEVDPSTICQCTGLKDNNGKLIWENDIVKDNVIFGSVSWDDINARFVIDDIYDGYQDYSDWWSEVEVIGNIFDNPELLEVGE